MCVCVCVCHTELLSTAIRCDKQALRFFDQKVGSVEVSYHASVERVMFPLPLSCRPGKLLGNQSHWDGLMYRREWTNRDQKDVEFVRYLLQLVYKERVIARLQALSLDFTINYWKHIQTLSFVVVLLLHVLLILGSYNEDWMQDLVFSAQLHASNHSSGAERRAAKSSSAASSSAGQVLSDISM